MSGPETDARNEELQKRAAELAPWQYRYELAPGVYTPISDEHHEWNLMRRRLIFGALDTIFGPDGYAGLRCIDGGCNAGLWSFELHKRGARDIDAFDARSENIAKCEFIREHRQIPKDELRFHQANLYDMEATFEPADLVMALGFMYHLSNPIEVARQIASVTKRIALVDSNVNTQPGSICVFRPEDPEFHHNGVESSVLVPNRNALMGMLRAGGFQQVVQVMPPGWMHPAYLEGRRVLLICSKEAGPSLEDEAC